MFYSRIYLHLFLYNLKFFKIVLSFVNIDFI